MHPPQGLERLTDEKHAFSEDCKVKVAYDNLMDQLVSHYTVRDLSAEDFSTRFSKYRLVVFAENHHLSAGYAY